MTVRFEMRLSPELHDCADRVAARRGQSLAELVRISLIEYLERHPDSFLVSPDNPNKEAAYEARLV